MKKQPLYITIALILLLLLASSVYGQDADEVETMLEAGSEPVTLGELLLRESFIQKDAWELYDGEDITLAVIDGRYRMQAEQGDFAWGLNDWSHTDVVIQVETEQLSVEEGSIYGVMCRADSRNNGDGYYFAIGGEGFYSIYTFDEGEMTMLVDPTESPVINAGQGENTFTVVCVQDYLAMYLNDELLAEINDSTFTEGLAGFSVFGIDGVPVDVAFDNLSIWEAAPAGGVAGDGPPLTLADYDGEWQDAISELRDVGLIGSGGSLVFTEDHAFFEGQGNWFTALARNQPFSDIVMAGELTFSTSGSEDFEQCNFTARIGTNSRGNATTYLDVGLVSDGLVLILDRHTEGADANLDVSLLPVDLDQPHHLLFILQDDVATVYLDGMLAIDGFQVVDRAGTYGISLLGRGPGARCDGRDIWVYQVPSFTPGVCEASSANNINRRNGPGTSYESPGQLTAGTIMEVTGQATGDDGFVWWQLEDDSWVRDDIVNVSGDCAEIPVVNP
jgi:hypothetical protein